jgi:hypothetical protein
MGNPDPQYYKDIIDSVKSELTDAPMSDDEVIKIVKYMESTARFLKSVIAEGKKIEAKEAENKKKK